MKVALVNLCVFADFGQRPEYAAGVALFERHNIELLDFATSRASRDELLDGFHQALRSDAELVLFASGGNKLIECLDAIDWDLVKACGKGCIGLSDFTHFSWRAVSLGVPCYYGLALSDFVNYFPKPVDQRNAFELFSTGKAEAVNPVLLHGSDDVDFSATPIVGGHSFISCLMYPEVRLDLSKRVLFLEHHYIAGETMDDMRYWAEAAYRCFKEAKPRVIVLGHSLLQDEAGQMIAPEILNEIFIEQLKPMKVPIYYLDHFKTVVPFD